MLTPPPPPPSLSPSFPLSLSLPCPALPSPRPTPCLVLCLLSQYYFTLSRFLDALDWHVAESGIRQHHLGVAVANADVNNFTKSGDEYVARMHALHHASPPLDWLNVFMMPIDEEWREHLWRWKTDCRGCQPKACFEMEVPCDRQ